MNEIQAILRQIVSDLEKVSIGAGGLEKSLTANKTISGELLLAARQKAAKDIETHFADLQKQIAALPTKQK